jgi:hypothetical protein
MTWNSRLDSRSIGLCSLPGSSDSASCCAIIGAALMNLRDRRQHLVDAAFLGQVTASADFEHALRKGLLAVNRQHDDFLLRVALQNPPASLDSADARHVDIHQDDIGLQFLGQPDALFAALRLADDANLLAVFE